MQSNYDNGSTVGDGVVVVLNCLFVAIIKTNYNHTALPIREQQTEE
jgi:hypothetical protein